MSDNRVFDLLVFDWDGTLMDSESHIVECMALALQRVGLAAQPAHQLKQVIGLGLHEAVAALLPEQRGEVHQAVVDAYRTHFLSDAAIPSELFPGVEQTLRQLQAAGYLLAIATGKSRRGLDKVLRQTGLEPLFMATRCADETFSKPHPQMLEEILTDLDTPAERALMIGDTAFDLQMAGNARVHSVGVSYGVHSVERLMAHAPLAVLDDIGALPGWLSRYGKARLSAA